MTTPRRFSGNFTQQSALPEASIAAANDVLSNGRLHRYNLVPGEVGEVAKLEAEYRDWQGSAYCLAVTSGGQALQIALRASGVSPGDAVLTNAFTLAPVPGAIAAVGGRPILVETDENLRLDLVDLINKAKLSESRFLLLSHMRGHLCDMELLMQICQEQEILVIEDCAHTMGARWNGVRSGNFGHAACFSTQTYKHINSGEGGLLTTNDAGLIARATILSGSYMNFGAHGAGPETSDFADARLDMPNMSARMDALRAAILRPQLRCLDANVAAWNTRYAACAAELDKVTGLYLPNCPPGEQRVGSSIQFKAPQLGSEACRKFLVAAAERGVELKWFGAREPAGFTSSHNSWRYLENQKLPFTDKTLATLFDMRLPLTFTVPDCQLIGELIGEAFQEAKS